MTKLIPKDRELQKKAAQASVDAVALARTTLEVARVGLATSLAALRFSKLNYIVAIGSLLVGAGSMYLAVGSQDSSSQQKRQHATASTMTSQAEAVIVPSDYRPRGGFKVSSRPQPLRVEVDWGASTSIAAWWTQSDAVGPTVVAGTAGGDLPNPRSDRRRIAGTGGGTFYPDGLYVATVRELRGCDRMAFAGGGDGDCGGEGTGGVGSGDGGGCCGGGGDPVGTLNLSDRQYDWKLPPWHQSPDGLRIQ